MKPELKIDWATHEAAKHACLHWHYSKCLPAGKLVKVGAWENGKFIGVVIFGSGANPNMPKSYSLTHDQVCELVRVALSKHVTPVSKIVAIAMRFLKKKSPSLRLIVSYADPLQGHHGGVYQAGNWIYKGKSLSALKIWYNGKWSHSKTVNTSSIDKSNLAKKMVPGKHTYLMPLDKSMKEQIEHLSKPYPKRSK